MGHPRLTRQTRLYFLTSPKSHTAASTLIASQSILFHRRDETFCAPSEVRYTINVSSGQRVCTSAKKCHSYQVPSTLYETHVYHRQSSNGSTVIVYGHDTGLRVVWYAGKKFKLPTDPPPKVNGSAKEDPMVIDLSDDDEPTPSQPVFDNAEFEQEEDEVDPSHPYHDFLRTLDIPLGSASLRLAVPQLPQDLSDPSAYPNLLRDHIIIAAACVDLGLRLVVCPILPPAPGVSDLSKAGVQIARLSPSSHQDLITSIALTYTAARDDATEDSEESPKWSFLVASTSCTGSGMLLIHQVPVKANGLSTESEHMIPIRRQHLRVPLISARLSFNRSMYPAERHSTLLITLPDASCVKVYQIFRQPTFNRSRRGSAGTTESASSTRSTPSLSANSGKWLITLLPEFSASVAIDPNQQRKSVLDAKWILGGRAVIALLVGGDWGVWDLEAAGPVSASSGQNLIKGQGNVSGITGGSCTKFAVKGSMPSSGDASKSGKIAPVSATGLVPATPYTRKVQAQGLFQGAGESTERSNSSRCGSISTTPSKETRNDEAVIINHGAHNIYIPSILSYWKSEATRKGSFAASSSSLMILPSLRTAGENIKNVSLLPQFPKQQSAMFGAIAQPNFLASTATRLLLFVSPLVDTPEDLDTSTELTRPLPLISEGTDQSLLQQGVLDVDGMDRLLENMDSPPQSRLLPASKTLLKSGSKPNFGKSVGFAREVDMDDTPDLPSPKTTSKLQISKNKPMERRLFS